MNEAPKQDQPLPQRVINELEQALSGGIQWRFLWTEDPKLIALRDGCRNARSLVFEEMSRLGYSIRAKHGVFNRGVAIGFVFKIPPSRAKWVRVGTDANKNVIYGPNPHHQWSRKVLREMRKLRVPDYQELLSYTPYNIVIEAGDQKLKPVIGFTGNRILLRAPQDSLAPLPLAEGWNEWTQAEMDEYNKQFDINTAAAESSGEAARTGSVQ